MCIKILAAILCFSLLLCGCAQPVYVAPTYESVLIDPGHGGFDGGASAADGTYEKDINLFISLCLRDMLTVCGVSVQMTRETDVSTSTQSEGTIRNRKVNDLQNRLQMYEDAALAISIHQNHFSSSKYRGTQIFYSTNHPQSVTIADAMQQSVVRWLQTDNTRQIKPVTDGIYLLSNTSTPAVLVECGFLSNAEETELLKKDDYRQQLAWTLLLGYFDYQCEM